MKNESEDTPPVRVGEIHQLKCISIGKKGDGIFKVGRFVVIAKEAEVGVIYSLKITKVLSAIAFAEIVE